MFLISIHYPVSDTLSPLEIQAIHQGPSMIDFTAMAISQQSDQELQAIQSSSSSSLKFTDLPIEGINTTLVCDTSTCVLRPYVPKGFQYQIFELLHSLQVYVQPNISLIHLTFDQI